MRIAYVRSSLHTGSGLVNHLIEIARRIRCAGNDVAIISRETEIKMSDFPIHKLGFTGNSIPFLRNLIFAFESLSTLKKFDLVHTQYHPCILVGNVAAEFLKKPHVFTYHGFAPIRGWRNYKQKLKMIDHRIGTLLALHSRVDKVITVSRFLKRELIEKYFIQRDKIRLVYNGVDAERFNPNLNCDSVRTLYKLKDCPVILYLGRLSPYKGLQYLVKAMPEVLRSVPTAKLLISGAMRYDVADLSRLVKGLKVREAIVFTGYVPDQRVPEFYAACDVFCYPSLWEGFGLTPAEAQACGKPVVAFNNCAIPEVVDNGRTGLLVEPKNVEALAEALISLLHDKDRRIRMGLRARDRVLRLFSWDKAAQQTLQVYNEVLS